MDEYKLYNYLARFDYRVRILPCEDVLQEMRYVLLSETDDDPRMIFRAAWRMFKRLSADYGYGYSPYEMGTREVPVSDFGFPEVEPDQPDSKADLLFNLYVVENYTASEICKRLGVPYSCKIRNAFKYVYKKRELRKLLRMKQKKRGV
jgi:hypothetical protein